MLCFLCILDGMEEEFFMNEQFQKQIKKELEQYKLEVKNKELQTQIENAKDTINSQNQHMANIYGGMSFLLVFLSVIAAIFGFFIPYLYKERTKELKNEYEKMKNDFEQKTKDVNNFMTGKFKEWENQSIDKAVDKYLKGELSWNNIQTILKGEPMSYEHMKKIFDFAKEKGDISPDRFLEPVMQNEPIAELVIYLFEKQKYYKNNDFEKIRNNIIDCKYFYLLASCALKNIYKEILQSLSEDKKQAKILELLKYSNKRLYEVVNIVTDCCSHLSLEVEKIITEKIITEKCIGTLFRFKDNQNIINIIEEEKFFDKVNISNIAKGEIKIISSLSEFESTINKDSYLAKRLLEYTAKLEQKT